MTLQLLDRSAIAPKFKFTTQQYQLMHEAGFFDDGDRLWLRWYDRDQNWILTPTEKEKTRADSAELELAKLKQILNARGISV
jgi:hypothetical protein